MHTGSIFLVVLDDEERGKSTKRASGKAEKRMVRRRPGYDVELSDEEEPTRVVEEVEVFPGNLREEKGGGKSSRAPNQVTDSALPASGSSTSMRWVARFVPTSISRCHWLCFIVTALTAHHNPTESNRTNPGRAEDSAGELDGDALAVTGYLGRPHDLHSGALGPPLGSC